MEARPGQSSRGHAGSLTHIGAASPPDLGTRPEAGVCAQCGGEVQPFWLPIPKRPRWCVAECCPSCAETQEILRQLVRRREQAERTLRDRIARAGLGSPYRASRTFATFRPVPGTERAMAAAAAFARQMVEAPGGVRRGLLFSGAHPSEPNGCGKTHLALAILHEVLGSDVARSGLFVQFADYLDALRRSFRRAETEEAHAPEWVRFSMYEVELLVLDDIASAAVGRTGWQAEEICRLLNHRIEHGRPIVATTDVGPDELADRLGKRVVSRLYEACEIVPIDAGDYRRPEQ